jgi:hypothetical protein
MLAFATVLVHGVMHDAGAEATLLRACGAMAVMSAVGAAVGSLAGWTVADAVRAKLVRQLSQTNEQAIGQAIESGPRRAAPTS